MALPAAILLLRIEVDDELLSLGSSTNTLRPIISSAAALITLVLDLISFKACSNALFFSHMDTQSTLFR